MTTYQAFEFDSATKSFTRRESSLAALLPGQVLVRVRCCTICGSDLHTFCGRRDAPEHCILGHEIIGTILAWGGELPPTDFHSAPLTVGQRITWAMAVGCGKCFYCENGLSQKCESLFKYGHEPGGTGVPTGGLSEVCVLTPQTPLFAIPDSLSDEVACPANCATATVSAGVRLVSQTHAIESSTALVIGAGMLGLTAAAMLRDAGARHVVVGDVDADRLRRAKLFGATHCVDTTRLDEVRSTLGSLTDGRGADCVMDFAGVPAAVRTAIASVRTGGCVLMAGSVFPTEMLSISPESIVRRMLIIRGLHNYVPADLARGLAFLERTHTRFPFANLVSEQFTLDQTGQAFEFARDQRPVRIAIRTSV